MICQARDPQSRWWRGLWSRSTLHQVVTSPPMLRTLPPLGRYSHWARPALQWRALERPILSYSKLRSTQEMAAVQAVRGKVVRVGAGGLASVAGLSHGRWLSLREIDSAMEREMECRSETCNCNNKKFCFIKRFSGVQYIWSFKIINTLGLFVNTHVQSIHESRIG